MANLNPKTALMKTTALGLKLVCSFINFIIRLSVTYVKHSPDVTAKDWQSVCLSKYRELLDYFSKKIAEDCLGKLCFQASVSTITLRMTL